MPHPPTPLAALLRLSISPILTRLPKTFVPDSPHPLVDTQMPAAGTAPQLHTSLTHTVPIGHPSGPNTLLWHLTRLTSPQLYRFLSKHTPLPSIVVAQMHRVDPPLPDPHSRSKLQVESQGRDAHTPLMHCRPLVHALPHRLQFSASDVVSRHTPSHRSTPSPSHGCPLGVALLVDALVDVTVVEDAADVPDTDEARDDDDTLLVMLLLLLLLKLTDALLTVDEPELLLVESDNELMLDIVDDVILFDELVATTDDDEDGLLEDIRELSEVADGLLETLIKLLLVLDALLGATDELFDVAEGLLVGTTLVPFELLDELLDKLLGDVDEPVLDATLVAEDDPIKLLDELPVDTDALLVALTLVPDDVPFKLLAELLTELLGLVDGPTSLPVLDRLFRLVGDELDPVIVTLELLKLLVTLADVLTNELLLSVEDVSELDKVLTVLLTDALLGPVEDVVGLDDALLVLLLDCEKDDKAELDNELLVLLEEAILDTMLLLDNVEDNEVKVDDADDTETPGQDALVVTIEVIVVVAVFVTT
ncbi:hypothetical protein J3E72DRAFT_373170 [Bipolaris maydis]|uniref:uncharacterized protein n=1 Tax=Cochliobolus heterostrophus TaxID=5016 RepID=UPI0024DDEE64|nr:hypothetical protein J3E73DRAFT_368046 [Bipolaris maydis]KAJ5062409.1 hypothetical protein J3E74DRAFT_404060 [Bipolaris maydis]KAJ6198685.1 hypothetical protein J3E72DRAFT_373170 [Bipolaris maydis]KAJ6266702.1 hypothetical protein PSV08DRAFT_356135 [Bipolaris maydis]KAJ6282962.1 hypothetical protein J3E71DRAFT_340646 [Bipolaris maydis]